MNTTETKKNRTRSAKSLIFTFSFILTAFTSVSTMAVPAMAAGNNTPKTVAAADRDVWQSATGECYHSRNNCGKMNPNKARQLKESEAKKKGLRKCKKCKW